MRNTFSVLIAIHQRDDIEKNFEKLISSIYANTLLPDQVLILVDGYINSSFKNIIYNSKEKQGFEVYFHPKNMGLAKILNIGLNKIYTDWVIRVDGDDISLPNRFQRVIDHISPEISIIGSFIKEFDKNNKFRVKKVPLMQEKIKKYLKYRNPFNHCAVAYRVSHVISVGGYPDLYLKEDYGLWVKMLANNYKGLNIPECLVYAAFDENSYSRRSGIRYLKSDLSLTKLQYSLRTVNFLEFIIITFLRGFFILIPNFCKKLLYSFIRSY